MNNEIMINQGIELLQGIDTNELDTVQIESVKYDDGSTGFSVEVTYPSDRDNKVGFKPEITD